MIYNSNDEISGVDEIPEEYKIFTNKHIEYVNALVANILLNEGKGTFLNIIEGIGLPERQEKAIKRLITNELHEIVNHVAECLDLVEIDYDYEIKPDLRR